MRIEIWTEEVIDPPNFGEEEEDNNYGGKKANAFFACDSP